MTAAPTPPSLPDRRSGIDGDGGWTPAFPGQRPPFAPTHGCYSLVKLGGRAAEIASALREIVPLASPADSATIDSLAMVLAQLERANAVLAYRQREEVERAVEGGSLSDAERDDLRRLSQDARGWANSALRYFEALGLTPGSRTRLGLDVVRVEDALASLMAEGRRIRLARDGSDE